MLTSLARVGLVWRCWVNSRPQSVAGDQVMSSRWLGVQWTQRSTEHTGHRVLAGGMPTWCLTLWATRAACRLCGAFTNESWAAASGNLWCPCWEGWQVITRLRLQSRRWTVYGSVAGADLTRFLTPHSLSWAQAGNCRKGGACFNSVCSLTQINATPCLHAASPLVFLYMALYICLSPLPSPLGDDWIPRSFFVIVGGTIWFTVILFPLLASAGMGLALYLPVSYWPLSLWNSVWHFRLPQSWQQMLGVVESGGLKTWNNQWNCQSSCIAGYFFYFTLAGLRVAWEWAWAWAVSLTCLSQIWVPAKDSLNSTPFSSIGLLHSPFKNSSL